MYYRILGAHQGSLFAYWPLPATSTVSDFDVLAYWHRLCVKVNHSRPRCIETPCSISARRVFLSPSPCRIICFWCVEEEGFLPHPRVELIWSLDLTGKEGFLLVSVLFTLHVYIDLKKISPPWARHIISKLRPILLFPLPSYRVKLLESEFFQTSRSLNSATLSPNASSASCRQHRPQY